MHLPAAIDFVNHLAADTSPEGIDRYTEFCAVLGDALLNGDHDTNGNLLRSNVLGAAWPLASTVIARTLENRGYHRWSSEQESDK